MPLEVSGNIIPLLSKWGLLISALIYFGFTLVVFQRARLLTKTLITSASPIISLFSLINTLLSLGFLLFTIKLLI
jgi:hypothetical protein